MAELPKPYELLELQDSESVSFRVERWEKNQLTIVPRHQPQGKVVTVIRVHVPVSDKPQFPHYWDLTAASLVAQIEPQLKRADLRDLRFKITAYGAGPKKRFGVEAARAALV